MPGDRDDMERPGGLIVRDLLRIPHFRNAVLLGGESGLAAAVTRVNVMEVPDVADWVRPGEFLMTTGYPFRKHPETLEALIAQLAAKGVAALGVKTKRFIEAVPDSAVRAADEHGLPLIELPPETAFSDVVREVMERVLVQESRQLSTLQNRVQRLSRALLQGDGLSAFLELLESLLGNPAALLEADDRCLASPGAASAVGAVDAEGWSKLREDSAMETCFLNVGGRNVRAYCSVALEGPRQPVLLLLLELRREFDIVDMLTMNWAGKLVGFEIRNAAARRRIEAKYIGQFLQDWIAGRIVSPSDLRLRAEACGCSLAEDEEYCVGLVRFTAERPGARALQELARLMAFERIPEREPGADTSVRWTVLDDELVALFARPRGGSGGSADHAASAAAASLRSVLKGGSFRFCLGRWVRERGEVPSSYREARRAAEVAELCRLQEEVVSYGGLGNYLLLYRLAGSPEAEEFTEDTLRPLLEYDNWRHHPGALLNTLKTYFECNGNVKETAERMFLHYNTVAYRLDRVKNELGIPLDDAETRLRLQLAIKLHEMKEV